MKHEVWKAGDIIQAENEQNQILTSVTIFRISVSVCVGGCACVCGLILQIMFIMMSPLQQAAFAGWFTQL